MPEVAFHFNAPDKLAYTARLLRKAWGKGARVAVLAPPADLDELARQIWLLSPGDFIPHSRPGDSPATVRHSPLHLLDQLDASGPDNCPVLVNLQADVPGGIDRFERVIEVVGLDEADRQQARQRWRRYVGAGIEPIRHDLKQAEAGG
ncbi:DNA polymerase III subunit chi [Hydrogenophaga sp. XSHU_21]